jgi:hypothetical protein
VRIITARVAQWLERFLDMEEAAGPIPAVRTHIMDKKFILFDFDGVIVDSFQPAFDVQKKNLSAFDRRSLSATI